MENDLSNVSANNDLDFYFNAQNIPNQDLVFATVEYFESGERKDVFTPLTFLNLLWQQFNFVAENTQKPHSMITALKGLPLTDEQKHILFGFILKWYGGYPVSNMNKQFDTALRLIEGEFLRFPDETPEKKFCQRDWQEYSRTRQLEKFLNNKVNGYQDNGKYDFDKVQEYLSGIPEVNEKLKFLVEIKTGYLQNKTGWESPLDTPFDKKCDLEIGKLETIFKYQQASPSPESNLKLSNRKGAKIDLIRVLNALYELRFFERTDGQIPTKEEFMLQAGVFFGTDLSSYSTNLSQSLKNQPLEANLKIFDEMKNKIQGLHIDTK